MLAVARSVQLGVYLARFLTPEFCAYGANSLCLPLQGGLLLGGAIFGKEQPIALDKVTLLDGQHEMTLRPPLNGASFGSHGYFAGLFMKTFVSANLLGETQDFIARVTAATAGADTQERITINWRATAYGSDLARELLRESDNIQPGAETQLLIALCASWQKFEEFEDHELSQTRG